MAAATLTKPSRESTARESAVGRRSDVGTELDEDIEPVGPVPQEVIDAARSACIVQNSVTSSVGSRNIIKVFPLVEHAAVLARDL